MNAEAVVTEFARRQREMYRGGPLEPVAELMADDIVWHVPGTSPIAGEHRGRDAVLAYFVRRRELAGGAMEITVHATLVRDDVLVQLADGRSERLGEWRTAGVYRVEDGRLAEAWLVPLDLQAFDRAWTRSVTRTER